MRTNRRLILLVLSALLLASSNGERISGTWQADLTSESKTITFVFHFKADGHALDGDVEMPNLDRSFPITKGAIDGDSISFTGFGLWSGTLAGHDLKLTRELDYGKKQQMVAHRVVH